MHYHLERDKPMSSLYDLSDNRLSLKYWQALDAFGPAVVGKVLANPRWQAEYPHVIQRVTSADPMTKSRTTLPGAIVYEMTRDEDLARDFYLTASEKVLFAVPRGEPAHLYVAGAPDFSRELPSLQLVSAPHALLRCGAYCIYMAVEHGMGYVGEEDIHTDNASDS
jgi:hypothetical protein